MLNSMPLHFPTMFGVIPTFELRSHTLLFQCALHCAYVWIPGRKKPHRVFSAHPVSPRRRSQLGDLRHRWSGSASTRFTAYCVFSVFGASAAYSVFFQYLATGSDDTLVALGLSFSAFLFCTAMSIAAQLSATMTDGKSMFSPGLAWHQMVFHYITFSADTYALAAMVFGAIKMLKAILMHVNLDVAGHEVRGVLLYFTITLYLLAAVFGLFNWIAYRGGVLHMAVQASRHFSKPKNFPARQRNYAAPFDGDGLELMHTPRPVPPIASGHLSRSTGFSRKDEEDAAFFLMAWDKYGGAVQYLQREPVPLFTLALEIQTRVFMDTLAACCNSGEWEVYGTSNTVESCCSDFLRLSARWFTAAEELETRTMLPFHEYVVSRRVDSLLSLEKVLALTRKAQEAMEIPSTEAGIDGPAVSPAPPLPLVGVTSTGAGDAATERCSFAAPDVLVDRGAAPGATRGETSGSFARTEAQSPSRAPGPSSASGSHVTIDLLPPLPTTYPPEPIAIGQARRPPDTSHRGVAGRVSVSTDRRERNLLPSSVSPSRPIGQGNNISPGPQSTNQRTGGESGGIQVTVGKDSSTAGAVSRGAAVGSASTQPVHVEHSPPSHVTNRTLETRGAACSGANTVEQRSEGPLNAAEDCSGTGTTLATSSLAGGAPLGVYGGTPG